MIWIQSKHENVLPFLGYQIVDDEPRLVSPWMTNGSLETYLTTHPDISEVEKLRFVSVFPIHLSEDFRLGVGRPFGNVIALPSGRRISLPSQCNPFNRSRRPKAREYID